ncbi:MAG: hypothetical protein PVH17_05520 [Anaerolineae bacterium]|jgi:hypothetical protein
MGDNHAEEATQHALKAVFAVIGDPRLQANLLDAEASQKVLTRLNLPESARPALLDIVNSLSLASRSFSREPTPTKPVPRSDDVHKTMMEAFVHIRWSFWVSMAMSIVLFALGMVFLGTAVMRSFSENDVSTATLTIAGLGIADFVLLFYTRPWQDIAANLSNSQQVKIIATSYLAGLSLLREGRTDEIKALELLTKGSVGLLEQFAEEDSSGATNPEPD